LRNTPSRGFEKLIQIWKVAGPRPLYDEILVCCINTNEKQFGQTAHRVFLLVAFDENSLTIPQRIDQFKKRIDQFKKG
jgi:hypothetical protein